jgi:predicted HAD superfamily Cof-like phosphohydrolase
MFIRVAEFHRAFGHPVGATPNLPDQATRDLRISLIKEELKEFCEGFANDDRVEMADALADLLYVLAGTSVAYGVAPTDTVESYTPGNNLTAPYDEMLREAFEVYAHQETLNDLPGIAWAINHMITDIFAIAHAMKLPIGAVFAEVHRSNMSKLNPDGTVLRRADGKILKGANYFRPDIKAVLEQHHGA